ncbi:DEAD/DEAH box helicase family protein [Undibacterium sp. JH2W]|uniref:DEAD/DEAH box helicase family protein n=1 Tax=Undibacterium sp. JH2W TaxID=3413037 RepID=UPI003BF39572
MVDFKKRLSGTKIANPIDPIQLYDTLDRAHDKGPLRPSQWAVLDEWNSSRRNQKNVIVKLHTGQGKTLIGLLMLQSRLNAGEGPVVYLCPDNFLISQTGEQAKQFGIKTCVADPELPDDFLNSKSILVTSVQKLFNGLTKFGLNRDSTEVGTLLMDDAHACSDSIRQQCRIRIPREDAAYQSIRALFENDLEHQGVGTYADILNEKRDAFLMVPYWSWIERESDVARILSSAAARESVKYAWPILKNMLSKCQCVVSGNALEIEPYIPPLEAFGTYWKASHRIFMSATVTDDAFLIKGLQLSPDTITKPLTYEKESWSGEKMVLLPSVMHEDLHRSALVEWLGRPSVGRKVGIVALVPSFNSSKDWEQYKATIANKATVGTLVENLKRGECENTVVLVNRYDGIDLPDDACRILIFDGKPFSESLVDLYQEDCRPNSDATLMRTVRTIEQGMGRSVRGEKDYSVVILVGGDLTRLVRETKSRKYLSAQLSTQIEIGLEVADLGAQDIKGGDDPRMAFNNLINQCILRNPDWKAFYAEQMQAVAPSPANDRVLKVYVAELSAERAFSNGDYQKAVNLLQKSLDENLIDRVDLGWYMQDMARYLYQANRNESIALQIKAHASNRLLLLPASGVTITKLTLVSQGRIERIINWIGQCGNYRQLNIALSDVLGRLVFGVKADKFEQALHELSEILGFAGERPDKEWKEGPDNLWALDSTNYILWECKNEVDLDRSEINKREAEQMNRSAAWFLKHYPGMTVQNVLIHPSNNLQSAAAFLQPVEVMRMNELKSFINRVKGFFKSFESQDFSTLSVPHIQQLIDHHELSSACLLSGLTKKVKNLV